MCRRAGASLRGSVGVSTRAGRDDRRTGSLGDFEGILGGEGVGAVLLSVTTAVIYFITIFAFVGGRIACVGCGSTKVAVIRSGGSRMACEVGVGKGCH